MEILSIKNLSVEYFRHKTVIPALKNVNFQLNTGESVSIVGESGSGKSTLAYSILKLIMPFEGRVVSGEVLYYKNGTYVDLLKISQKDLREIRGKKIAIIFQDPSSSLNPVIKIGEQIRESLLVHNSELIDVSKEKIIDKIFDVVKLVQLQDFERIFNSYPHQLSGGQRQRICIAISIINNPQILIADEPTTALDVTVQKEILELLWFLKTKLNMSIIFITHNLYLTTQTDRICVMYNAEIVEAGKTDHLLNNPQHPYTKSLLNNIEFFDSSKFAYESKTYLRHNL